MKGDYGDETAELIISYSLNAAAPSFIGDGLTSLHNMGIQCSDGNVRTETLEELKPALERLNHESKISRPVSHGMDHFARDATTDIESLFLISKSNCAFVNYKTELVCAAAMSRFTTPYFRVSDWSAG